MAGVDVDVKDLMLLLSYEGSFRSAMGGIGIDGDGEFGIVHA